MTAATAGTPATGAGLRVAAGTAIGPRRLEVTLAVAPGDVVALVGPNGAGKSTALELVLGLRPASDGRITLDHRVLVDGDHDVPPGERGLGWAPQAPGLLPRRSVARQVATFARPDHAPLLRDASVADLLDALLLGHLAGRRPDGLSGGEAQRVAVARALAHGPVVLLDEPTSAQDPEGAAAVRRAVRAHAAAGGSAVVVSHRPEDAWLVADRATVMEDLRTIQHGTPEQLAAAPASSHVARLVGLTVLRGIVGHDHVLRSADGDLVVGDDVAPGPVVATLRAEAVTLHRSRPPASSARNVVPGVVARLDHTAAGVRIHVDGAPALVATLTAEAVAELDLRPGVAVWASCKASEVHVHGA